MSRNILHDRVLHDHIARLHGVTRLLGAVADSRFDPNPDIAESDIASAERAVEEVADFLTNLRFDGE
jgi:hypothetical protein